ncbi:hypothetical protein ACRAWD_27895 [Caulobacter segnis]
MPKALHLFYLRNFYKDNAPDHRQAGPGRRAPGSLQGKDPDLRPIIQG